jgi:beta-lactamase regulating signal transducer with metallopeptidase domain
MSPELAANALGAGIGVVLVASIVARIASRASATFRHAVWRLALAGFWVAPALVVASAHVQVESYVVEVPVLPRPTADRPPAAMTGRATPETALLPETALPSEALPQAAPPEAPPASPAPATRAPRTSAASQPLPAPTRGLASPPEELRPARVREPEPVVAAAAPARGPDAWKIVLGVWLVGALVGMAALIRDGRLARRLQRGSRPLASSGLADRIARWCREIGLTRPPSVLESSDVSVPTVVGWPRAKILVPSALADMPGGLDAAIVHELAHVRRGDVTAQVAARLTRAVCWWHPLAWLVSARLSATAEEACDDWAVALTGHPREYAAVLVRWAEATRAAGGLGCAGRGKALIDRVRRITSRKHMPSVRLGWPAKALLAVGALAAVIAVSVVRMRAVAAEPEDSSAPAPGPGEVIGTVTGPDSKPVEGARVWLIQRRPTEEDSSGKLEVLDETETDAEGRFTFRRVQPPLRERRSWNAAVLCHKPGLALGWRMVHGPRAHLDIGVGRPSRIVYEPQTHLEMALERPRPIRGTILTDEGEPIPGAQVALTHASIERTASDGRRTRDSMMFLEEAQAVLGITSGDDGSFDLSLLPLEASASFVIRVPGYVPVAGGLERNDRFISVRLGRPVSLRGAVACPDPTEVAGREVVVYGSVGDSAQVATHQPLSVRVEVHADESGRFAIDGLPPGRYGFSISLGKTGKWQQPGTESVAVEPGASTVEVSFALHEAWPIKGRVIHAKTGNPMAGVPVRVYSQKSRKEMTATTHENGVYLLYALPGPVSVSFTAPEGYTRAGAPSRSINVVAGQTAEVPDFMVKPGATIKGIVVDEQGHPVAGAGVWEEGVDRFYSSATITTDENGQFEVHNRPAGAPLTLYATHGDTVTAEVTRIITGKQKAPARLVLSAKAASFLEGRVADQAGKPVVGAEVRILRKIQHWTGPYTSAMTDKAGKFRSSVLIPGYEYSIIVRAENHVPAPPVKLTAEAGKTHDLGEAVLLRATGTVRGSVVDTAGKPVPDAIVSNSGDCPQRVSTLTDDRGRFQLGGLFEGTAYVAVEAPGYRLSGGCADAGTDDLRIVLPRSDQPTPSRPSQPPAFSDDEYRRFAERAALEGLALTRGTEHQYREAFISTLVDVNPRKGLEVWEEEGWIGHDRVLVSLVEALAGDATDEALYYASRIDDAELRAYALREAGVGLAKKQPELAADMLKRSVAAAREGEDRDSAALLAASAAYEMSKLGMPEAGKLLDEALRTAKTMPHDESGCMHRSSIAKAACRRDLDAALGLVEQIPEDYGHYQSSAITTIAYRTAFRDAAKAEQLLSRLPNQWSTNEAATRVAYAIALKDSKRALKLARSIKEDVQRALALGNVAVAVAGSDRELALGLIDEAAEAATLGRSVHSYSGHAPPILIAHLARLALDIGYADMQGLVARAMSGREPWDTPDYYGVGYRSESDALLGAQLSWVDGPAARHAIEAAFRAMERAPEGGLRWLGFGAALRAAAVIDPEWAFEIIDGLPADDPKYPRRPEVSGAEAYRIVASTLSRSRDEKKRDSIDLYFWIPDPDLD